MAPISRLRWRRSAEKKPTPSPSSISPPPSLDKTLPPPPPPRPAARSRRSDMTTVLVGAKQHPFTVNRTLLCEASPFFAERLQDDVKTKPICLWLPGESSTMFGLFVQWVHSPVTFRRFLDQSISVAHDTSEKAARDFEWALIRLHLFASHLDLYRLQDLAMDALQDLYLGCDWDVPPSLIEYLYTQCEAVPSVRVRRWAVAMVAFSLTVPSNQAIEFRPQDSATSDSARFQALFVSLPDFATDYATHVNNMTAAGLDICCKNPQLRIPANKLRNDQRLFGFRECSFHSHRAAVGENRCPYNEHRGQSKHAFESQGPMDGQSSSTGQSSVYLSNPLFKHLRSISSGFKDR